MLVYPFIFAVQCIYDAKLHLLQSKLCFMHELDDWVIQTEAMNHCHLSTHHFGIAYFAVAYGRLNCRLSKCVPSYHLCWAFNARRRQMA